MPAHRTRVRPRAPCPAVASSSGHLHGIHLASRPHDGASRNTLTTTRQNPDRRRSAASASRHPLLRFVLRQHAFAASMHASASSGVGHAVDERVAQRSDSSSGSAPASADGLADSSRSARSRPRRGTPSASRHPDAYDHGSVGVGVQHRPLFERLRSSVSASAVPRRSGPSLPPSVTACRGRSLASKRPAAGCPGWVPCDRLQGPP